MSSKPEVNLTEEGQGEQLEQVKTPGCQVSLFLSSAIGELQWVFWCSVKGIWLFSHAAFKFLLTHKVHQSPGVIIVSSAAFLIMRKSDTTFAAADLIHSWVRRVLPVGQFWRNRMNLCQSASIAPWHKGFVAAFRPFFFPHSL